MSAGPIIEPGDTPWVMRRAILRLGQKLNSVEAVSYQALAQSGSGAIRTGIIVQCTNPPYNRYLMTLDDSVGGAGNPVWVPIPVV